MFGSSPLRFSASSSFSTIGFIIESNAAVVRKAWMRSKGAIGKGAAFEQQQAVARCLSAGADIMTCPSWASMAGRQTGSEYDKHLTPTP